MKELYLDYSERHTGGEILDPNERWSSRSDAHIDFMPRRLVRDRDLLSSWLCETLEVNEDLWEKETLYMVVVRYSDGDTFGRTSGHWKILGLFEGVQEAIAVRKSVEDDTYSDYKPWKGYFASLESVGVEIMDVR